MKTYLISMSLAVNVTVPDEISEGDVALYAYEVAVTPTAENHTVIDVSIVESFVVQEAT